ncbi:NAD(P)/FAD-dependent oxidoreductase [Massilia sp. DWR3-1-1]|uniref:NAD(P)/FAD-dependent oxidoreductase n=1 Tax=Massilia sp. DWR3-1-1 TaxID=2804559 RepID=UPI003CF41B45
MRSEIVVVGGGAGGLELACKLGRKLGPSKVALVDSRLYHIWKPSLHEVAAGTLDIHQEGLSYQMLAHDNGFTFVYGAMTGLDTAARRIDVAAVGSGGEEVLPARTVEFSKLVLAVGSTSNYFGVPGAAENTISLNATEDAERFRLKLLRLMTIADQSRSGKAAAPELAKGEGGGVDIVIIGGGATGVELAAELREASSAYASYGFERLDALRDVHLTLLEGAPRILSPLPEKVSNAALGLLHERAIKVVTNCRVTAIEADHVLDAAGNRYPADLCVWAAGIRAPEWLSALGLPTGRGGQIEVDERLQVKGVPGIYAMGDCAACIDAKGASVPPRAQAAHQQAAYLLDCFVRAAKGQPAPAKGYVYTDYGSLVSVGNTTSVGSLMGALQGFNWFVEGMFARMMYVSLHLMHHRAVLGTVRTALLALARFLIRRTAPLVKLH